MSYSHDDIVTLIALIEERECLWNVKSPDYMNQIKRTQAYREIAGGLPGERTVDDIKKKIKNLRAQFSGKCLFDYEYNLVFELFKQ